jgi:hypothetical protein
MRNSASIAAVTATLQSLLIKAIRDLPDATVTAKPPHRARTEHGAGNQLNLFLYQTAVNAASSGKSIPKPAPEIGKKIPQLGLNLYYLITAYGKGDDDILAHRLLGLAMTILNEHTELTAQEMQAALPEYIHEQQEPVRVIPHPLSPDDLSKLWSTLQTSYEISVAYQVSVVVL